MLTHRQMARKKTRTWQAAAVALLAVAGAAAMLPVQKLLTPREVGAAPTTDPDAPTMPPAGESTLAIDSSEMSRILGQVGPAPLPVAPPPPPVETAATVDVAPPPAPPAALAYIGSIITPRTRHAVVRQADSRRLVREGDEVDGARLVSVEPDQITLDRDGVRQTLTLEERTNKWPTDPPKRPVAFKTPSLPVGAQTVRPINAAPGMPQTFDAAREQARARALAEAAKRAATAPPTPPPPTMPAMAAAGNDEVVKYLSDPNLAVNDESLAALERLGVKPGMNVDDAVAILKGSGVQFNDATLSVLKLNTERGVKQDYGDLQGAVESLDPLGRSILDRLPTNARPEFLKRVSSGELKLDSSSAEKIIQQYQGSGGAGGK